MTDAPKTDKHLERIKAAITKVETIMALDKYDGPNYAPIVLRLKQERDKYQMAIA